MERWTAVVKLTARGNTRKPLTVPAAITATIVTAASGERLLLIDSMPARHRGQARAHLHRAVAAALIGAATNGVNDQGEPASGSEGRVSQRIGAGTA